MHQVHPLFRAGLSDNLFHPTGFSQHDIIRSALKHNAL